MSFRISGLHGPVGNEPTVNVFLRQNRSAPPGFAMKTFDQVLESAARHGGVNLLFEKSMYSLIDDLDRIVSVLRSAQVSFEVVGGVAVNAYILGARRSRSFVTRDIDILVDRRDLDRIVSAAEQAGYTGRKIAGGFMLIRPGQNPEEAVHLLFTGEKPRTSHPLENPELRPEEKRLDEFGVTIPVAGLPDLVRMKLNSFRPKDETHLETLDQCGLITPEVEAALPEVLRERLAQARSRFSPDEFET